MEEMKDRIRTIMESQQMSQQEFAKTLGIPPSTLSSIFTGRTNPTNNHTQAIHRAFPSVNINWLMFGEGKMLLESTESGVPAAASGAIPPGADAHPSGVAPTSSEMSGRNLFDAAYEGGASPAVHPMYPNAQMMITKKNDMISRKIKEIRVFYDDGTYESFVPGK